MGLRLPSSKYFEVTHPRCVFQLEIFLKLKTVGHNGDVSSQNKTRYVESHSWRFSAICELLR